MEDQFYVRDPEEGVDVYGTAQEAQDAAEAALDHYRDQSHDGWHEDISGLEWGRMVTLGHACQCDVVNAEDDETGRIKANGFDYSCDYELVATADELSKLRGRVAELSTQREEAMQLAERIAGESDSLRAMVAELEARLAALEAPDTSNTCPECYHGEPAMDGGPDGPTEDCERCSGVVPVLRRRVERLGWELDEAIEKLADLALPPVVPEGWVVLQGNTGRWRVDAARTQTEEEWERCRIANLRALLWALEHNARPPHAADGEKETL